MRKVRGYKVFDPDWTCRGFQYTVGATYTFDGKLELCVGGFHFCLEPAACFNYKAFNPNNRCAEVEALGKVVTEGDKSVTNKIKIVREIPWDEVIKLCNNGKYNTGYANIGTYNSGARNIGNQNTGACNKGDSNAGDENVGYGNTGCRNAGSDNSGSGNLGSKNTGDANIGWCNTGDYNYGNCNVGMFNYGDRNSGFFNTKTPVYMFNKPLPEGNGIDPITWPLWLYDIRPTVWLSANWVTEPDARVANEYLDMQQGYLKCGDGWYASWKQALAKAKARSNWPEELKKTLALPNFNYKVFKEITGITKEELLS